VRHSPFQNNNTFKLCLRAWFWREGDHGRVYDIDNISSCMSFQKRRVLRFLKNSPKRAFSAFVFPLSPNWIVYPSF